MTQPLPVYEAQGLSVYEVAYHRNGPGGEPFHAVRFRESRDGKSLHFLATVFEARGHVTVICLDLIEAEGVGPNNKWCGDYFEHRLRLAVQNHLEQSYIDAYASSAGQGKRGKTVPPPRRTRVLG